MDEVINNLTIYEFLTEQNESQLNEIVEMINEIKKSRIEIENENE